MNVQLLCDELAVPVCVQEHERYYPHPAPPPYPTHRKTHRWGENGVADEGKSGVFWGHRWGGFGVTDEGLTPKNGSMVDPGF